MASHFRALAIDFDGTLADGGPPVASVLNAIAETRAGGRRIVLVTGRILDALRAVFPGVEGAFDAVVAENGGVIWTSALGARPLAQPVSRELGDALEARGVPLERGRVVLATLADWEPAVIEEVRRLGLEVVLTRNRQALMLLPPGVTKGTGLLQALAALGMSPHSALAVGDAENDHSLIETCELGVAVANAVPSLLAHADVVLRERDGDGVLELLRGPLVRGEIRVAPSRWRMRLGAGTDGTAVCIPGSQVNLLISGGSGTGKSCLAGLLAERLVVAGYVVCVLDPEGDHLGLGSLRPVTVLGGAEGLPLPEQVTRLLRKGLGGVVVDLSLRPEGEQASYCRTLLGELARLRVAVGLPHWIVLDEAHLVPEVVELLRSVEGSPLGGLCLVTYHAERLRHDTLRATDYVIVCPGEENGELVRFLEAGGFPAGPVLGSPGAPGAAGRAAWLLDREGARPFTVDRRLSSHVRHWHKYLQSELPMHRRFHFRRGSELTGAAAANLAAFHAELARCEPAVLRHHAAHRDFSRWVHGVLQDHELARRLAEIEARLAAGGEEVETARLAFLRVIEARYVGT